MVQGTYLDYNLITHSVSLSHTHTCACARTHNGVPDTQGTSIFVTKIETIIGVTVLVTVIKTTYIVKFNKYDNYS